MKIVRADLNARTSDGRVRVDTPLSTRGIEDVAATAGMWVWLYDEDVRVPALLGDDGEKHIARAVWQLVEDVATEETSSDMRARALDRVRRAFSAPGGASLRLDAARYLGLVENIIDAGRADYLRSRLAQQIGERGLAVVFAEEAVRAAPEFAGYVQQWLNSLVDVDPARALVEARTQHQAFQRKDWRIAFCLARALGQAARQDDRAALHHEILEVTHDALASGGTGPTPAVRAGIHVTRGFAFMHVGQREEAIKEFTAAIAANPEQAEPYAARGLELYPAPGAVDDLRRAIVLGHLTYWPFYYLAHHSIAAGEWGHARANATRALELEPPPRVRANLLEFLGICDAEQGRPLADAARRLEEALHLAPNVPRIANNLKLIRARVAVASGHGPSLSIARDVNYVFQDLAA